MTESRQVRRRKEQRISKLRRKMNIAKAFMERCENSTANTAASDRCFREAEKRYDSTMKELFGLVE